MAYFGVDKDVRVKELVLNFQNQVRNRVCHAQKLDQIIQATPNNAKPHDITQLNQQTKYSTPHTVRTLKCIFQSIDKDGSGALNKAEFEAGLAAFGIFPKTQDLSAILKFFDKNGDGVVQYEEFTSALREPMSTRKTILVEKVWHKISGGADSVSLDSIDCPAFKESYGLSDSDTLTKKDFFDYYADLAMQAPSDDYFGDHITATWAEHEDVEDKITHEENMRLLGLIRQRLITVANGSQEAYALRKIYMQYDSTLKRGLTIVELAGIVAKLGIDVDEKRLRALFTLIDMNRNGVIEFDELSYFIIDELYK